MKVIRIHDHLHTELKVVAARKGKAIETVASQCISHCLKMIKKGELEIPALDAADKRRTAKR